MSAFPLRDFLIDLAYRPLFWPFALFVPFFLLAFLWAQFHPLCRHTALLRYAGAGLAVLLLAAFAATAWANLRSEAFSDDVEAAVASVSALFWNGRPIYHDSSSLERYSLPYGPLLFAIVGLSQGLLGPTVFATKLPGTLAAAASLVLTFLVIAKATNRLTALSFTGLAAALLLHCFHISFGARSDALLVLTVALGLFAATRERSRTAVFLGICLGVAVNLKVHAFAYFLPILALAARQDWSRRARIGGWVAAGVTAVLPFLIFPQVSLGKYLATLRVAAQLGFGIQEYRGTLEWCVTLAFPALFAVGIMQVRFDEFIRRYVRQEWTFLAAVCLAFILTLIPAAMIGAGKRHFLPFIPIATLFAARAASISLNLLVLRSAGPALAIALGFSWIAGCSIAAFHAANFVFKTTRASDSEARRCAADLLQLRDQHRDAALVVIPSGDTTYQYTFGRFRLVFDGMPAGFDPATIMVFVAGNAAEIDVVGFARATIQSSGKPALFVAPKDGEPFSLRSYFPPFGPLFSDHLRSEYHRVFMRVDSTEFFDVYQPRPGILE